MVVFHIVAFKTRSASGLQTLRENFLALPERCLHPKTGESYIKIARGGKQISTEGKDRGMQVCFVMEFDVSRSSAIDLCQQAKKDQRVVAVSEHWVGDRLTSVLEVRARVGKSEKGA
ncbi:hypothetical protein I316_02517 [Kwoniella heveanensis BCC8398]|uniref:Stress-response A/B barrel domain-containing protein n=1 Tax=Kwoniella heveanensis BCC8398 TaxID=1296120 RepID=A0A1B9GYD5_9TREE|nr:hypothetical protein I316_02517 [Kwoniella heveanensis BCC8398]